MEAPAPSASISAASWRTSSHRARSNGSFVNVSPFCEMAASRWARRSQEGDCIRRTIDTSAARREWLSGGLLRPLVAQAFQAALHFGHPVREERQLPLRKAPDVQRLDAADGGVA